MSRRCVIAKEVVTRSDISNEPGARTYVLEFDSQRWEIDLTEDEVEPILAIFRQGRQVEEPSRGGRGMTSLDRRIRNVPNPPPET